MTEWEQFFDQRIRELVKEKNILDIGGVRGFQKHLEKYLPDYRYLELPHFLPWGLAQLMIQQQQRDMPFYNPLAL